MLADNSARHTHEETDWRKTVFAGNIGRVLYQYFAGSRRWCGVALTAFQELTGDIVK